MSRSMPGPDPGLIALPPSAGLDRAQGLGQSAEPPGQHARLVLRKEI